MNRIRQLRDEHNLRQQDIATLLHKNISTVSKYELEQIELSAKQILILADYFNVTTDYLLGRTFQKNLITINVATQDGQPQGQAIIDTSIIDDGVDLSTDNAQAIIQASVLQTLKTLGFLKK